MATVIKIKNLEEGYQSIITNGTNVIIGDQPLKSKGTGLGFGPSELVLSGLAMCKVATIRYVATQKAWDIGEVRAELSQDSSRGDHGLISNIKVSIEIEGDITEEQRQELFKQADNCHVHRQLNGEWNIEPATQISEIKIEAEK
ncbi:OsmC family protein [Frigoriflavimonas asaccharolytica]|uniref:Putative redox protein n=1 Tax=Frigoriflavimonas asaccharolytica TaxID=2735899 RepID=A0A8J8GAD4_9FLAO|nr:OsmC family protein [Frigoriflavimonas asaccharolytica]NRS92922.1 putative redox protein [Frigoriflavimonas asaccharolytica]